MKETSQSAPEYSLLLRKKAPTVNKKFSPPPKLGPKKNIGDHSFQNCLDT